MVVKEDGTKWACQSCLKGHRVSGCNHTDRELTLVPKKGRPVTQCQHCRLERKKRSAHVKCDCGEAEKLHHPKEKCIHLREAEERAKAGFHDDTHIKLEEDTAHLAAVAEEQGCCCHHGGKCSCSLIKKEPTSTGSSPPHGPAVPKPRLETVKSDGSITVFANGHHKPVHRKNHAAHECGMPYKMPLPRAQTEHSVLQAARRSVESLPLQRPFDSISSCAVDQNPLSNITRRLSKSEQPSPKFGGTDVSNSGLSDPALSNIDFSALGPILTNQSIESGGSDAMTFDIFEPMFGVTEDSYDPWSTLPSAESIPNNNPFGAWATQLDTSNVSQPALTAASSGTQSEIDEIPAVDDLYGFPMPSFQEDAGTFAPDTVMTESNSVNRRSLPPNFFGNTDFTTSNIANAWQMHPGPDHGTPAANLKSGDSNTGFTFNGWSTSTMSPLKPLSPGPVGVASSGRPQSQSVGRCSAPNDDLMKQLFPDIDVIDGQYMTGTSPINGTPGKIMTGATSTPTSHPIGSPSTEAGFGFVSQSWSDGSLSVPVDAYTDPYNLQSEYSSSVSGPWPSHMAKSATSADRKCPDEGLDAW